MKQILQNLRSGETRVTDVSAPGLGRNQVLIQTRATLISAGTERMLVEFGKAGLIAKAKAQPDKVKQVLDKIKTDGLMPTMHSVFSRLDEPLPLGYCNAGVVLEVGAGVTGFKVGDRVANNGPHAEIVCVPQNLCAKVPDNLSDEHAAFTVLASIGLQGIRLVKPTLGETVVVYGLGLIGLVTVQLLKAAGCNVIGIDLDGNKLELARKYGANIVDLPAGADPIETALAKTNGKGVDAVIITASAKTDEIIHNAAEMCRKRARIVLVGVIGLNLRRPDFYEKELTFQVSCSYGPGRYDDNYEQGGQDYPPGFVRWTEQRNFEAILDAMAGGRLDVSDMIAERIPQSEAASAYQMLTDDPGKMAMILTYPTEAPKLESVVTIHVESNKKPLNDKVVVGLIGAGNFAKLTLLPAIKPLKLRLKTIADIDGVAGTHAASKFGFEQAANDYQKILADPQINTVFITTRHDMHAKMVIEALKAGKHVHVEKPLALNREELQAVSAAYRETKDQQLLVGFNRRFSPHAEKMHQLVSARSTPMCMSWMVNAGHIPANVWIQNSKIGGGRIIGEGCHWLDFMGYLVGHPITSVSATMIGEAGGIEVRTDKMTITVTFADGSLGTLHYFANGHKSYQKETFELFCDGKILRLDNFRKLRGYGWRNFKKMNLFSQNKGHAAEFKYFTERIRTGGKPLIPFGVIENMTLATFAAMESAESQTVISL